MKPRFLALSLKSTESERWGASNMLKIFKLSQMILRFVIENCYRKREKVGIDMGIVDWGCEVVKEANRARRVWSTECKKKEE